VSAALVLSAPFVGQVRGYIRSTFPGHFVAIVGGIVATGVLASIALALVRIREQRAARYGALAVALAAAAAYAAWNAGPNPESNAVERFHFVQYGLITFLFYRAWRPIEDWSIFLLPILAGLIVGTVEEWFQWFIPNRIGEMNDVLLNLAAITCGLLFSVGADPPNRISAAFRPGSLQRMARLGAVALLAFAAFVHTVHFGYTIADEEIGTFESRLSRDSLLATQEDRTSRWKYDPPPIRLVRLSREDQYLTEGIQHVRRRNASWSAGDFRGAWLENLILEKYYAPVLDTPTHEGAGHRWPADQRADGQARAAAAETDAPFASDAYPYRILRWNRWGYWITVAGIALSLLWIPAAVDRSTR
jgi:VanZ family protein